MKIVAVSDIHGDARARRFLDSVTDSLSPDLLVICGDFTTFGPASVAEAMLEGLKVKCAAVPGNCDPDDVAQVIEKLSIALHGRREVIDGIPFIGIGGSPCCTHSTPREYEEDEIGSILEKIMVERCVVVSHAPPYGMNDLTKSGRRLGSVALAKYVDRFNPRLVLSGHVHEARNVLQKGRTFFANPGPLKEGFVVVAELSENDTSAKLADFSTNLQNL